ncbi:hypothetical protein [Methanococcoides sp. AM1]|uniref:hypothetical protein n=1 Tax=Methanococcoides sp. AM1 TaxID=1201011 RepID=UPI0010841B84|nr:hypothetical protein [Methanococcoides sp. AM1]
MKTLAGSLDQKSHSPEFLRAIQVRIAASVSTEDDFIDLETIAGSDCAFLGDLIICGVVLLDYDTMDVIEIGRYYLGRSMRFQQISETSEKEKRKNDVDKVQRTPSLFN